MRKKLRSFQRTSLIKVTKAFKTVSNPALSIIANVPPIHLTIEKEIETFNVLFAGKMFTWKNRPFTGDQIYNKVDIWQLHPPDKISFNYLTQPISQTGFVVFTDGSQDKTDIGAAFIILEKSGKIVETKQYKLLKYSINFEAEGIALSKALEYLQTSFKEGNVQLYTDSLSTLKVISNRYNWTQIYLELKKC